LKSASLLEVLQINFKVGGKYQESTTDRPSDKIQNLI